jgi:hypothetical protein
MSIVKKCCELSPVHGNIGGVCGRGDHTYQQEAGDQAAGSHQSKQPRIRR